MTPLRNPWTARSCSHQSGISCQSRCGHSTVGESSPLPGSVTSNTRHDGREFLAFALRYHVRATTHVYPMSRALQALQDLKAGLFDGAAVLVNDRDTGQ